MRVVGSWREWQSARSLRAHHLIEVRVGSIIVDMIAAITTASLSFLAGSGAPHFVLQQGQQPVVNMVAVRHALQSKLRAA